MSLLDRIFDCSEFTPDAYRPFVVDGKSLGRIRNEFATALAEFPDVFIVTSDAVTLSDKLTSPQTRTAAVAQVLEILKSKGMIPGWRGEPYPVSTGFYDPPLLTIERASSILFGTMAYGVNLNAYVRRDDGIHMWIARRSAQKPVAPGKLDHIVAGGQPTGLSVSENLIKECWEEAGIPAEIASQSTPVGTISYLTERAGGLRHSLFFNFDLELDDPFEPNNIDGEVDEFFLWHMDDVMDRMATTEDFKFDVPIGILDFAVRHGILSPDNPDYIAINEALRMGRAGPLSAR
ncbi:DUF4743 domain-containing protein [Rhodospirillales bacterium]|nr:DUF4743 domain-containing protein [Rhodospirillales bacterium]